MVYFEMEQTSRILVAHHLYRLILLLFNGYFAICQNFAFVSLCEFINPSNRNHLC